MSIRFEIFTNNKNAGVIDRARRLHIPCALIEREQFNDEKFLEAIGEVDLIILAGFLWLVPEYLTKAFSGKIINIHPALLPAYGGKGMYGDRVHKAVIDNKEKRSGITIHHVNEKYDEGEVIVQATCKVETNESPETLAGKIHRLEFAYFPIVIEQLIEG